MLITLYISYMFLSSQWEKEETPDLTLILTRTRTWRRDKQGSRARAREHEDYEYLELAREAKLLKDLKKGAITEKEFTKKVVDATVQALNRHRLVTN